MPIELVAFDADDTLWQNEPIFIDTQARFCALLERHIAPEEIERSLAETELRNLKRYGYGIKPFTLSMIETAVELTAGEVTGAEIAGILQMGRDMLDAPVRLFDGAAGVVAGLASRYPLIVVTKGDLLDQETKIARSGLGDHFSAVEVVSSKDRETYEAIAGRHRCAPDRFAMVGNSLRSDVIPVAGMGGHAVYIPYGDTWEHESVPAAELDGLHFETIPDLAALPALLESIAAE